MPLAKRCLAIRVAETRTHTVAEWSSMSEVLTKEVATFNMRILAISVGTFNTNMGNASTIDLNPISEDYKGSFIDKLTQAITGDNFEPDGDLEKAITVIYEVMTGEGVGTEHEDERFPLSQDPSAKVKVQKH